MAENALNLTEEQIKDMSLVDLALELLRATNKPHYYRDIMNEIARLRGMSEEEVNEVIARLYTEINMDGRFICIGNNVWGLKRWYPTEKSSEKSTGTKKFVRKEVDWEDEEEDDVFDEEEEEEETLEVEEEDGIYLFGRDKDDDNDDDDAEDPDEGLEADLELTEDAEDDELLVEDDLEEVLEDDEVDADDQDDDEEDEEDEEDEKDEEDHL